MQHSEELQSCDCRQRISQRTQRFSASQTKVHALQHSQRALHQQKSALVLRDARGALCVCSGDRATTGLTLVIVMAKTKSKEYAASPQYEQMIYHFYELAHFQHTRRAAAQTNTSVHTAQRLGRRMFQASAQTQVSLCSILQALDDSRIHCA